MKVLRLSAISSVSLCLIFALSNAQAASCKIPKSYYKNVACTSSAGYFLASKDFGAPVALIDKGGKPVVNLSNYEKVAADKISGGLIPVQRNNRVGYINLKGREVVPTMYTPLSESGSWARAVSDSRIIVKRGSDYGVISTSNQTIVPFSSAFSDIDDYRNGKALARKNKASSWLDKDGNAINDSKASGASASNTAAKDNKATAKTKPSLVKSKPATFTTLQPEQQDGKWGFVDDKKVVMITYSFDEVRAFSEGLAGVRIDDSWGFLNLGGELMIPFNFKDSSSADRGSMFIFKDNQAWVGTLESGDKVCIGKQGNVVNCA